MSATRRFKSLQTAGYVLVSVVTRGAGMVRELLLLGAIGIGAELDALVLVLVVPALVALLTSPVLYTNVTPEAARLLGPDAGHTAEQQRVSAERLIGESVRLGVVLTLIAAVVNVVLAGVVGLVETTTNGLWLAAVVSSIVLFTVIAEYCSAMLTALQRIGDLVASNLFISLPAILALLVFDLTITSYVVVFALSFAFRTMYLLLMLRRVLGLSLVPLRSVIDAATPRWDGNALSAGSAVIAVQGAMQVATLFARLLPVGSVSLLYFGLRLPQLYLSTVWFVVGTDFFGAIQRSESSELLARIRTATARNVGAMAVAYLGAILFLASFEDRLPDAWRDLRLDEITRLALYCLPIIAFIPLIDMTQKTLATVGSPRRTLPIAVVTLGSATVLTALAAVFADVETMLVGLAIALGFGAAISARQLRREFGKDPGSDLAGAHEVALQ